MKKKYTSPNVTIVNFTFQHLLIQSQYALSGESADVDNDEYSNALSRRGGSFWDDVE